MTASTASATADGPPPRVPWSTAALATLHCLTGCAIGEILGMVIGTATGLPNIATMVLAVALAFVFGYALTARALLRAAHCSAWNAAIKRLPGPGRSPRSFDRAFARHGDRAPGCWPPPFAGVPAV